MKRVLTTLIAVLALTAAALPLFAAAQSEGGAGGSDAVTLNIIHNYGDGPRGEVTADVFEAFMDTYPNVQIEQEVFKDLDIPTKVEVAFYAGREPEIVFSNYFLTVYDWLTLGIVVPINDYLVDWGMQDSIVQAGLRSFTESDGRIAGFPLEGYNWPIWYNMEVAAACGIDRIPTTMEELMADIPKIRAARYEPYVTAGNDGESHQEFDMFAMLFLTDEEVNQVFHEGDWSVPNAVRGVELFARMRDAGLFSSDTPGLTNQTKPEAYYRGNVFMQHGGSWGYSTAPEEIQENVVLGGFPIPEGSAFPKPTWQCDFGAKGVFITRNGAEQEDAVHNFVTFLYSPENIRRFVVETSMLSPIRNLDLEGADLNPLFVQSMQLDDDLSVMVMPDPVIPSNVNLISLTKQFYLTGSGSMTSDEMLEALTRLWAQARQ